MRFKDQQLMLKEQTFKKKDLYFYQCHLTYKLTIHKHIWKSDNIPGVGVRQIPLVLAWAITIHKSQGSTLDLAEIDVGNNIFEAGQTYVALSRVKELNGLFLKSFNPGKILINKKVKDFYNRLNENSKTQQDKTTLDAFHLLK